MTSRRTNRDVAWLNAALFDRDGFRPDMSGSHIGLPIKGPTRRLIPRQSQAAAASFDKSHDAMSARRRQLGQLTQRGLRLGAANLMRIRGLALEPELGLAGDPERSVLAQLRTAVPQAVAFAVTLGPRRANRKPVVQLFDADGTTLAYAKIAADDHTEQMVANEAAWLARMANPDPSLDSTPRVLAVPALIGRFEWAGRTVAVIAAAIPDQHEPSALSADRVEALAVEIADAGDRRQISVADALAGLPSSELGELSDHVRQSLGDRPVNVSAWHGDLSPWNTISERQRTWVLDWETASASVPVGADAWHHQVMVATHLHDVDPATALADARGVTAAIVGRVAPESDPDAAFALYLLELVRRDAAPGAPTDPIAAAARHQLLRHRS